MSYQYNDVPPDWLIIETVIDLQKYHNCRYRPSQRLIFDVIRRQSSVPYDWKLVEDRLQYLAEQKVLLRSHGGFHRSVKYRIHPDFYPDESLENPYKETTRDKIRAIAEKEQEDYLTERRLLRYSQQEKREYKKILRARSAAREMLNPKLNQSEDYGGPTYIDSSEGISILREAPEKVFFISVETTGLHASEADILELSIIDGYGNTLMSKRYSSWFKSWDEAQYIHNIGPEDVEGLPKIEEDAPMISELLKNARALVGYPIWFQTSFLRSSGIIVPKEVPRCDVMDEFSQFIGEVYEWSDGPVYQKLSYARRYFDIHVSGEFRSLSKCRAIREVFLRLYKAKQSADDPSKESCT